MALDPPSLRPPVLPPHLPPSGRHLLLALPDPLPRPRHLPLLALPVRRPHYPAPRHPHLCFLHLFSAFPEQFLGCCHDPKCLKHNLTVDADRWPSGSSTFSFGPRPEGLARRWGIWGPAFLPSISTRAFCTAALP